MKFSFVSQWSVLLSLALAASVQAQEEYQMLHGTGGLQTKEGTLLVPKSAPASTSSNATTATKNYKNGFGPVSPGTSSSSSTISAKDYSNDPQDCNELKKLQSEQDAKISMKAAEDEAPVTHSTLSSAHQDSVSSSASSGTTSSKIEPRDKNEDSGNRGLRGLTMATVQRQTVEECSGIKKIVQCRDGVEEEECKAQLVAAGVEVVADMPKTAFFAVCVESQAESNIVAELTDVDGVEDDPERTLSVIPESHVARHLAAQETPYGISMVKAPEFWSQYGTTGEGKKVCIIDTGLRSTHQDIKGISSLTGTNDASLVTPWNADGNTHGTHVAGTVAAQDNSVGVIGVAPGVDLHIIRVFDDSGSFTASSLVVAMNACGEAGADVISMSLGGSSSSVAERWAVNNLESQGILIVAAAGNDGDGVNAVEYPAGYSAVMSVGALDEDSEIASFSTHNSGVDISGPGVAVLSTVSGSDSSYAEYSGTSMATPHVSAAAALLWSQFPDASVSDIRNALEQSAADMGACGKDRLFGNGLLDLMAAADYLESGSVASEISGCTSVVVELLTDDWGAETTYRITPKGDSSNYVYRGGPYTNDVRATYTDEIELEDGCYTLFLLDSYGDGNSASNYGIGSLSVTYDGTVQVDNYDEFTGSSVSFEFGNCGTSPTSPTAAPVSPTSAPVASPTTAPVSPTSAPVTSPTPAPVSPTSPPVASPTNAPVAPTSAPVPSPTAAPVASPTRAPVPPPTATPTEAGTTSGLCASGEWEIGIELTTDRWSRAENSLYFYDEDAADDEFIWIIQRWGFRGNTDYEGWACADYNGCYKFYFIDSYGDGLVSGGLTLTQDGVTVLQINPNDDGASYSDGGNSEYWYYEFGSC
eukprot:Nitzschia sp. Nitz4//scaffold130_size63480//22803//25505//NITZ4_006246-RA/size63480-augustus-gene-0.108-mRNA-1//-1//CDS//3329535180//8087//frame0